MIEVRLFGTLRVRRADGTMVAGHEWRTSKVRDLLRLLALAGGQPVPIERVLDSLWPATETSKARASLRNAASQLRRTLGADCITRENHGMALRGAWVDTDAFVKAIRTARARFSEGDLHAGVELAREALALANAELCVDEPYLDWLGEQRAHLIRLLREISVEAAEAALADERPRAAAVLAERCLSLNPMAERAARVAMQAFAQLGEIDAALATFERCRQALADELGADPSAATREIHVQVLRAVEDEAQPEARDALSETRALVAASEEAQGYSQNLLAAACALLQAEDLVVLEGAAVLSAVGDGSFVRAEVQALITSAPERVSPALDTLEDLGLVERRDGYYRFVLESGAQAAYGWVRPSRRRQLHEAAAQRGLSDGAPVGHWVHAGEPERGRALARQTAGEAGAQGDWRRSRKVLAEAVALSGGAPVDERLELGALLAETDRALGRHDEAEQRWQEAFTLARRHAPQRLPHLLRRAAALGAAVA